LRLAFAVAPSLAIANLANCRPVFRLRAAMTDHPRLAVRALVSSSPGNRLHAMATMTWIKPGAIVARASAAAPGLAHLIEIKASGPPLSFAATDEAGGGNGH
jgi:hypothetical protein